MNFNDEYNDEYIEKRNSLYEYFDEYFDELEFPDDVKIKIAHIDTGITEHPYLEGGFIKENTMDFTKPQNNQKGKGVITVEKALSKKFGDHGTATAGLIINNEEDENIKGIIPRWMIDNKMIEFHSYRVGNSVVLSINAVNRLSKAINHAVKEGCKIISISLGAEGFEDRKLRLAMEYAVNNGVIICCAAGQLVPFQIYPAAFSHENLCICCAASTAQNEPWKSTWWNSFQNGYVTIAAPGTSMPKIYWEDIDNPSVKKSEGSSYSTAYTASVAALWYLKNYKSLSKRAGNEIVRIFKTRIQYTRIPWEDNRGYSRNKIGPGILNPKGVLKKRPPELR
ncbi:S8/S53 family peptidase [Abyssalbus ytuae]|uniref:S8/S53 family peptidase n=1 Tax=Abyssalbus ytuae TaxID=2926907 RepID=A0A9E6ZM39_9FLAO|nr:S8/S53 family peptidase [Abyssalbus ytuae]UOB18329.1 S8/S53 family peptidase [Abyssalbus ytuae]